MATGTMKWFGLAPKTLLAKEVNYLSDTIKGMLTTVTYVPDQDAHDYKDDVTNEVTGTNYTAGGMALANKTVTYTAGTNVGKIDAEPFPCSAQVGGIALNATEAPRHPARGLSLQGGEAARGRWPRPQLLLMEPRDPLEVRGVVRANQRFRGSRSSHARTGAKSVLQNPGGRSTSDEGRAPTPAS